MFGTQHEYYIMLKNHCDNSNSQLIKSMNSFQKDLLITGLSGCLAGLTEDTLTPFERVQAVLQMRKVFINFDLNKLVYSKQNSSKINL